MYGHEATVFSRMDLVNEDRRQDEIPGKITGRCGEIPFFCYPG